MAPRGTSRRIADELRGQIRDGTVTSGAMLPSELQLSEQYGVARGTVRSALGMLVGEGLVEVVPGVGRKVVRSTSDHAIAATTYERIASDLSDRIKQGEFDEGTSLPSESVLVAKYQVSRNTVRRAYRLLRDSGIVVVRHGSGAFVRKNND